METSSALRHQLIRSLLTQNNENIEATVTLFWEPLAKHIVSLVGEGGFNSLYERSLFLNQSTLPLLAASRLPVLTDPQFANLKKSFKGQTPEQINEANRLLLITLTDILASLIGEPLTARILQLAWGNAV